MSEIIARPIAVYSLYDKEGKLWSVEDYGPGNKAKFIDIMHPIKIFSWEPREKIAEALIADRRNARG